MPDSELRQVQLRFPYAAGRYPTYANAVLVNSTPDGVIIDFGFFDPFLLQRLEKDLQPEAVNGPIDIQPLERLVVSHQTAKQLIAQLTEQLGKLAVLVEEESNE